MWFLFCGAVYGRVGSACGWWLACSAVSPDPWLPWCGFCRVLCCLAWLVAALALWFLLAWGSGLGVGVLAGMCVSWPRLLAECWALGPRRAGGCWWVGGCPLLADFPAVLVSWSPALSRVAGLGAGLRVAAGGWLSCVLVRCWVVVLVEGLSNGVVRPGVVLWRVVVWWLLVMSGPVAGGRSVCVRFAAVVALVPLVWCVGFWPVLVCSGVGVRVAVRRVPSAQSRSRALAAAVARWWRWWGVGAAADTKGWCWSTGRCSRCVGLLLALWSVWRAACG